MFACFQPISWVAQISGLLKIILGRHPASPVRPQASYTDHGALRLLKELPTGPEPNPFETGGGRDSYHGL